MNVLMINGSPRGSGNTAIALREMKNVFAQEGIEVTELNVGAKAVRGCIACNKCAELGKCVFDDAVNEAAPLLAKADGVVVASPVYYASANGNLISFLDRLFYSSRSRKEIRLPPVRSDHEGRRQRGLRPPGRLLRHL